MTWTYTPYAGILWTTAFISACVAYLISRRPKTAGIIPLILLMASIALWAFASGLEAASIGLAQKLIWANVEYLGSLSAPTLFLIFVLDYSLRIRWLRPRNMILLFIFPIIAMIATLTNKYHGLIWSSFTLSPTEPNTFIYGHGVGYYILIAYDYLLVLAGLIILFRTWIKSPFPYRRQVAFPLVGSLFPIATGIVYTFGLTPFPGLDLTPISFLATGIILAAGIFSYQLFDLMPIANDALVENMLDGVLVLDARNHIAKVNPFAEKLIETLSKDSIGQPVETSLNFWGDVLKRNQDTDEIRTEVLLPQDPPRFLELHISTLYDKHKHFAGRLVIFRDITERHLTELELARNIEELKIINRISMIIAGGLDMERILKALHEQCSQVVSIDVFYVALCEPVGPLVNIPIYYEEGNYLAGTSRDIHDHPGIIGGVIKTRQTLYLQDDIKHVTRPLVWPISKPKQPSRSYIGIPLTARDQVIGVMVIQNLHPNAYTADQVHLLERIALQAAIAIENARLYAEEQRLAIIDELTGVYNYRGLLELGSREVERARRFNHLLALLFFDIDDFRNLNNTYSHTAGNLVLQAVVKRCRTLLRNVDVFSRFGGDEFVVLLPETDLASSEVVARRLVEEVSNSDIATPYGNLRVTISVGVAILADNTVDLAALVDRANQAEHQSKQGHKSKVTIAL